MPRKAQLAKTATATPAEVGGKPARAVKNASHDKFMEVYEKIRRKRHDLYKKLADM